VGAWHKKMSGPRGHPAGAIVVCDEERSGVIDDIPSAIKQIREYVAVHGPLSTEDRRMGEKYSDQQIIELLIDFYRENGRMPRNSTEYRDDYSLPHSTTVKRHFGSLEEAHRQALEVIEGRAGGIGFEKEAK